MSHTTLSMRIFGLAPVAAVLAACAGASSYDDSTTDTQAAEELAVRAHVMPVRRSSEDVAGERVVTAPTGAHLTYYGGPVLANVKIVTVFWNHSVAYQSELNTFYADITKSTYMDWLKEYDTPTQHIGRGSFGGTYVDTSAPSGASLKDTAVQSELARLIDAHSVPAPDADTLYMIHFPPGVNIKMSDGSTSCSQFCAYHSTFKHGASTIAYGIMPDQGGACAGGCGSAATPLDNLTMVSSHELVEAITDAQVGLATSNAPPLGWYDSTNGEIGDICATGKAAELGTVTVGAAKYTVQTEWSNAQGSCVVAGTGSTCTPSCTGKTCGGDGCGGSCGTCAAGATCSASGTCTTSTCTPSCTGKTCGSDGCGGACGTCGTGQTCGSDSACHSPSTCAHDKCSAGGKLASSCNACVAKVCAKDAYCCSTKWNARCVREVATYCDATEACP